MCSSDLRMARLVASQGMKGASAAERQRLTAMICGQDQTQMLEAFRQAMAFDSRPRLAEIRCPTLIVAGEKDRGVPAHHAHALHGGIHGSELKVITGAGHGLIWEKPDELVRTAEAFLCR